MKAPRMAQKILAALLIVVVAPWCEAQAPAAPVDTSKAMALDAAGFKKFVADSFEAYNFDALDKVVQECRHSQAAFTDGTWKLAAFYEALTSAPPDQAAFEAHVQAWSQAYPNSSTPWIAYGGMYVSVGWAARGGGTISTVSHQGYKSLKENLAAARKCCERALEIGNEDPYVYVLLIRIGAGEEVPRAERLTAFEKGVALEARYLPLYDAMTVASLPRWSGEQGDPRRLAEWTAEKTREQQGEALYFYIGFNVAWPDWTDTALQYHVFDYGRLKQGYDDFQKQYPAAAKARENSFRQFMCCAACMSDDRATAASLFKAIGDAQEQGIWTASAARAWRKWANGEGPRLERLPIHEAAENGDSDAIAAMIAKGVDVNAMDAVGRTPLSEASLAYNRETLLLLLNHGANPRVAIGSLPTPFECALGARDDEMAKFMVSKGADPDPRNSLGYTPLHRACIANDTAEVTKLLDYGADPNIDFLGGYTLLQLAVQNGNRDILRLLLEHGADPNAKARDITPLALAVKKRDPASVDLLLKKHADPNCSDEDGFTALFEAADNGGNIELVRTLVSSGANINQRQTNGWSVFHAAVKSNAQDILAYLLEKNPEGIAFKTNDGRTLLQEATQGGHTEIAQYLVQKGAKE